DILAQHGAPAGGCACQHDTHSIDEAALREIHRLCRKISPLHARDELYDSICDSTRLSHFNFASWMFVFVLLRPNSVIDSRTERGSRIGQRPLSACARKSPRIRLNSWGASRLTV